MLLRSLPLDVQQEIFEDVPFDMMLNLRASFFPVFTDVPHTEKETQHFQKLPVITRIEYRAQFMRELIKIKPRDDELAYIRTTESEKLSTTQKDKLKPALEWLIALIREDRKRRQAEDPRRLKKEKAKAQRLRRKAKTSPTLHTLLLAPPMKPGFVHRVTATGF